MIEHVQSYRCSVIHIHEWIIHDYLRGLLLENGVPLAWRIDNASLSFPFILVMGLFRIDEFCIGLIDEPIMLRIIESMSCVTGCCSKAGASVLRAVASKSSSFSRALTWLRRFFITCSKSTNSIHLAISTAETHFEKVACNALQTWTHSFLHYPSLASEAVPGVWKSLYLPKLLSVCKCDFRPCVQTARLSTLRRSMMFRQGRTLCLWTLKVRWLWVPGDRKRSLWCVWPEHLAYWSCTGSVRVYWCSKRPSQRTEQTDDCLLSCWVLRVSSWAAEAEAEAKAELHRRSYSGTLDKQTPKNACALFSAANTNINASFPLCCVQSRA